MHGLPLDTSINHLRTVTHILNDLERTVAQELGVRRLSWEAYAEKGAFFWHCCGSVLVVMRIRILHLFSPMQIPVRIQAFLKFYHTVLPWIKE